MTQYNRPESPLVRYYDVFSAAPEGDVSFYVTQALQAGGPVLELACGTGRILIPIAQAGVHITGLDLSPAMLARAQQKLAALPADVQQCARLVQGDMSNFSLDQRFALIMIPFNSFALLATPERQRAALHCIYNHLEPGGRFAFSIFDPSIPIISAHIGQLGNAVKRYKEFDDPDTGRRVVVYDAREYDLIAQTVRQEWVFEQVTKAGKMVRREHTKLLLRYAFRYENQYLLELCGFEIEALYGDFQRGPFRHGYQQVWIARRPA